jgi:hypothetical protein
VKTLLKFILAAAIIAVCLILLISLKGRSDSGKRIHTMIFLEDAEDWENCDFVNCEINNVSNSVVFGDGESEARLITENIAPGFPFRDLMLSWNSERLLENRVLKFEVSVSNDGEIWHDFQYQVYGQADSAIIDSLVSLPTKIENVGEVNTDILNLQMPMKMARVTVSARILSGEAGIVLRRISLCFASDNASWRAYGKYKSDKLDTAIGEVKLAVPYYTQRGMPEGLSGNSCSPTAVAMVINHHEKGIDLIPFCYSVYDPYHDKYMYGNWPYNVQAAYLAGMSRTWVEIHTGFGELYNEIVEGKPVVISIAFGRGELPNSPIQVPSEGHLITVVGFDGPDIVICNDPAGHNIDDGVIRYPRKELERAWLDHGGIAYHLWP